MQGRVEMRERISPSDGASQIGTPGRIKTALMRAIELAKESNRTLAAIRSTLEFEGYSTKIIDDVFSRAEFRTELVGLIKKES